MTFYCPSCKQSKPLDEGQLVFEVMEPTLVGYLSPTLKPEVAAAIFCPPCVVQLMRDRAENTQ